MLTDVIYFSAFRKSFWLGEGLFPRSVNIIRMMLTADRTMKPFPCRTNVAASLLQPIAGHESPRTTKLYDRTDDAVSINEIDRIEI
jgi:hypothetical protein